MTEARRRCNVQQYTAEHTTLQSIVTHFHFTSTAVQAGEGESWTHAAGSSYLCVQYTNVLLALDAGSKSHRTTAHFGVSFARGE